MQEKLISNGSRRYRAVGTATREFSVIDEGGGLDVEGNRGVNGHDREHGDRMGNEAPFDTSSCTVDKIEQCSHTFEE